MAHGVLVAGLSVKGASHGPEFVDVAMALYAAYGGIDRRAVEERAHASGVAFGGLPDAVRAALERALQDKCAPAP